jgi:hypothetical protein
MQLVPNGTSTENVTIVLRTSTGVMRNSANTFACQTASYLTSRYIIRREM